ncbi:hypothetical protein N9B25_00835 [bacterium]|nr:hypothetical protein [bacterium]
MTAFNRWDWEMRKFLDFEDAPSVADSYLQIRHKVGILGSQVGILGSQVGILGSQVGIGHPPRGVRGMNPA